MGSPVKTMTMSGTLLILAAIAAAFGRLITSYRCSPFIYLRQSESYASVYFFTPYFYPLSLLPE